MIDSRILIGLVSILIAISGMVYIAINEPDRQAEFKEAFEARSIANGAGMFNEFCSPCHGVNGQGVPGRGPTLNSPEFFKNRLEEVGYQGSLESYITLTVAGGRPVKSDQTWPENMPTWSTDYGGPLRNDQVDNITDYILNWGQLYEDLPADGLPTPTPPPGGPEERGEVYFEIRYGCVGCHAINGQGGATGPELTNIFAEQGADYIEESIYSPNAVIADGYQPNVMPQTFRDNVGEEELSDIISYLESVSN